MYIKQKHGAAYVFLTQNKKKKNSLPLAFRPQEKGLINEKGEDPQYSWAYNIIAGKFNWTW